MDKVKEIPNACIDTIITSPPYWALRDYGAEGQWGLEPDFHDYLKHMQELMVELKRILKSTGTCWINMGDTYSGGVKSSGEQSFNRLKGVETNKYPERKLVDNYGHMKKSRFGIPERFYADCIDNGWLARNHVVWHKPNHMPESVKDRLTCSWESIFFFAKEQKYYFNLDAIRQTAITETKAFNVRVRDAKKGLGQKKLGDSPKAWKMSEQEDKDYNEKGERKQDNVIDPKTGGPKGTYEGFNDRGWNESIGKNPGDVLSISPKPFKEAHFATFPEELPLTILKCACPENGMALDPFFGAGTVGVAAEKLGFRWCGIELNPEYIEIARKRLAPYQNNKLFD